MSSSTLHSRRSLPGLAYRPRGQRAPRTVPIRRFGPGALLGSEPPLDVDSPAVPANRHALSVRWLGASVLTAVCGFLLIGSAIVVSQRGDTDVIESPETEDAAQPRRADSGAALKKGDKLVRAETVASAKQTFRTPVTIRSGDRERIVTRSFTRLSTTLAMNTGVYAASIPAFNPMRFISGQDNERALEAPPSSDTTDADEVSIMKSDLATLLVDPLGPTLSDQDAEGMVAEEMRASAARTGPSLLALPTPNFLPRAVGPGAAPSLVPSLAPIASDAFRSIEVRVVPENLTNLPKPGDLASESAFEDRIVSFKRGETLENTLRANGASQQDARTMATLLGRDRPLDGLQLRLLLAPPEKAGEPRTITRAILYGERGIEAIAAMNDRRAFVSVAPPPADDKRPEQRRPASTEEDEPEEEGTGAQLFASVYETAAKHDIPRQIVEELVRVMGYDVDFQRRVQQGDSLELVLGSDDEAGDRQELLSATLTLGGESRRVFRYVGEDGSVDYFDEAGRSLKKFLLRKPILEARLTSGFGVRIHPVLGYAKGHKGVDWANKTGTPIFAAGNGTIIKADWSSGYGRRIEIQHANGYVTTYNHQSAFARGIAPGVRVRQGQVIGYVGSTGLSTGAHLHYEVIVNGTYVDPMKIRVPRGRELDGRALAEFNRQRDQITSITKRGTSSSQVAASDPRG